MEQISGILFGFCFAAVVGGLVHLMAPGGNTERAFRLLVTLFMLSAVLAPLSALRKSVPTLYQSSQETMLENVSEVVLKNAECAIRKVTENVLSAHNCSAAEVEITMQVTDGEAHTQIFVLRGIRPENAKEIADEIFTHTGERPTVEPASGAFP